VPHPSVPNLQRAGTSLSPTTARSKEFRVMRVPVDPRAPPNPIPPSDTAVGKGSNAWRSTAIRMSAAIAGDTRHRRSRGIRRVAEIAASGEWRAPRHGRHQEVGRAVSVTSRRRAIASPRSGGGGMSFRTPSDRPLALVARSAGLADGERFARRPRQILPQSRANRPRRVACPTVGGRRGLRFLSCDRFMGPARPATRVRWRPS
jgi:hypothetical protein